MTKLQKPPLEARKARHMGATVYAVGVKDFLQSQLEGFADTKEHAFGVLGGFKALQSITDKLGEKSCIELKSLDPVVACVGGEYRVVVRGSGFQNTRDKSSVICRFKFTDNSISGPSSLKSASTKA
ncbi:anthrax toxin receptor 1-like isoform X2 [Dasypus novemcinctus]|uniref:anthrax toxin receptor 1-like isoform X2 n=1 Tax=Dasypus novemcinctus TaxID=9361 RepID=UPI0039C9E932